MPERAILTRILEELTIVDRRLEGLTERLPRPTTDLQRARQGIWFCQGKVRDLMSERLPDAGQGR